jgi:pyrroloquinoline-quinone synthase
MTGYDELKAFSARLFANARIENHRLFELLARDQLSLDQARRIALEIYHVVDAFPRFLSAILTNIPDYRLRMPLVENLFEEHGRMEHARVHVETYKNFLRSLGIDEFQIAANQPLIPAIAYMRAIIDLCLHHPFAEGLGALGVIEEIVARVSPLVAGYAIRRSGDHRKALQHFGEHEVLDVTHAEEIYRIAGQLEGDEALRAAEQGMSLGLYYHRRLYSDLVDWFVPEAAGALRSEQVSV